MSNFLCVPVTEHIAHTGENRWFNGTVQEFSEDKGYLVLYDDEEEMWEEAGDVEAGERTRLGKLKEPSAKLNKANKVKDRVYLCGVCGQPKKGHVCAGSKKRLGAREESPPGNESDEAVRGKRDRRGVARYADDEFESPKSHSRLRGAGRADPASKAQRRVWNATAPSASRGARAFRGREQDGNQEGASGRDRELANDTYPHEWWRKYGGGVRDTEAWWARVDMSKPWLAVRAGRGKKGGTPRKKEVKSVPEAEAGNSEEEEWEQELREKNKLSSIRCLALQVECFACIFVCLFICMYVLCVRIASIRCLASQVERFVCACGVRLVTDRYRGLIGIMGVSQKAL